MEKVSLLFSILFQLLSNVIISEQTELSAQLVKMDKLDFDPETLEDLRYIGGVDLSFPLGDNENAVACLIVMSMPDLKVKVTFSV